jgi:hypothetical protein
MKRPVITKSIVAVLIIIAFITTATAEIVSSHAKSKDVFFEYEVMRQSDPPDRWGTDPPDRWGTDPPNGRSADPPDGRSADPPNGHSADPPDGWSTDPPGGWGTDPPVQSSQAA